MSESADSSAQGEPDAALPASPAAPPTSESSFVECPKCHAHNPPGLVTCVECNAKLLPGRTLAERVGFLAVAVVGAAVLGGLAYWLTRITIEGVELPDCCASPVYIGLAAVLWLIGGLGFALGPTPKYEQYVKRAQRHAEISPQQALADLNTALELAPKKQQPDILKQRSEVYAKLGRGVDALTDLTGYAESSYAHGSARFTSELTGLPTDAMAEGYTQAEIRSLQDRLVREGALVGIGWCGRCRDVVELDQQRHCSVCGRKVKQPHHVRPEAREAETQRIRAERARQRRSRMIRVGAVALLLAGGTAVCATTDLWPFKPRDATPTASPAAGATVGVTTFEFEEEGIRFEAPSDWQRITATEVRALLRGSLKGVGPDQYRTIGGVYFGGVDDCPDCARIVVIVLQDSAFEGSFTDEQYERVRDVAEQSMGARLIQHRKTVLAGLPGAESVYIGRSERTHNWDIIAIAPEPGIAYMIGCSALTDEFDRFEPIFARAFETLRFAGVAPEATPQAAPTVPPTAEPTAAPTLDLSDCRLGSVFQADVTVPDDTPFTAGETFTKTWRLRNAGSCLWVPGFRFTFVEGDQMGGPDWVAVPETAPGADAEISVMLVAPSQVGRYRGAWQMCVTGGECFGDRVTVLIRSVE